MIGDAERRACLALALARGVGPSRYAELLARHGTAGAALDHALSREAVSHALQEADTHLAGVERQGGTLHVRGDPCYPPGLADLADPPPFVVTLGRIEALMGPAVAIVGTREPTPYGRRVADRIAREIASRGGVVVSGMARGIDAVSHEAALHAGGLTTAVVGGGVDIPYPASHRELHDRIRRDGLVISEAPCGQRPGPGAFPRRNRLIAALARVTLVVEAGRKSGALITAMEAAGIGRPVAAVPGPVDSPMSEGTNALLRDGAHVMATVDDLLQLADMTGPLARVPSPPTQPAPGDSRHDAVARWIGEAPVSLDQLVQQTGRPARDLLVALTDLELAGVVEQAHGGFVRVPVLAAR